MAVTEQMQGWDEGAWCLAAVAVALVDADQTRRDAAMGVLDAAGVLPVELPPGSTPAQVAAQAAAPLTTIASLVTGLTAGWMALPDEALLAQGEASGQMAPAFKMFLLPALAGLAERLSRPGARMLDVGTGIGAIATGFAEAFPELRVTGIDVAARVLKLAAVRAQSCAAADRVTFRQESVADLVEQGVYDLAWLPAPFVPEEPLRLGVAAVARALAPGGWLLLGHGKFNEPALPQALNRFKTLAYGGTALDDDQATELLTAAGLQAVAAMPTPPGAPAITVGQRSN